MKRWLDDIGLTLVVATTIISVAFLIVPVAIAVVMSFDARDFLGAFPPPGLSLKWYYRFFSEEYYMRGLYVSLIVGVAATGISTAIGVSAALAIDRYRFRGRELITLALISPLIIPAVVIGFALLLFLSFLGVDGYARLIAGHVIVVMPYTIRATLAGLVGIKRSLVEAALSLGANERQAFWKITFPLARTGIVAGGVFAFAFSLDEVAVSLFLVSGDVYTLPVALLSMMRGNFDLTIAAASVLMLAVTALLIVVLDRVVGLGKLIGQGVYRN